MIYRCIPAKWTQGLSVLEGEFTVEELEALNQSGYNIYFFPNFPSQYKTGSNVAAADVDTFNYVFIDMDMKAGKHLAIESFIARLNGCMTAPQIIVNSGHGVHAYWKISDLDAMSFLKLQRRLCRFFNTDEAVSKLNQLMRAPNTINTKNKDEPRLCEVVGGDGGEHTCEQLDNWLPPLTKEDEAYCINHFERAHNLVPKTQVDEKLPAKFGKLMQDSQEAKDLFIGNTDDRSKADYRLGHIMFASGFSREEAMSVLVNCPKALARGPSHRVAYAELIVDKIWTFEITQDKSSLSLSSSVRDILSKAGDALKGTRLPCWRYLDATAHGFRLGQVIGLVAGSGVGKTAMALNMFEGFVELNPDYHHFFVPLEQPANEIADRWKTMCGTRTHLYDKVHVISNYADDGTFRHLSLTEIKDYLLKWQKETGFKIGCVVIDHIGALKKTGKDGENQGIMDICHEMKAFAITTNTLLVMQSQSSREKAGIGDLELDKDAAYGTVYFESYCDYLITIWQPLKRKYATEGCPTITAYKFCKIRHKKGIDEIKEDTPYRLFFDSVTEHMRLLTQDEETSFDYFNKECANLRKRDRKTSELVYTKITWDQGEVKI